MWFMRRERVVGCHGHNLQGERDGAGLKEERKVGRRFAKRRSELHSRRRRRTSKKKEGFATLFFPSALYPILVSSVLVRRRKKEGKSRSYNARVKEKRDVWKGGPIYQLEAAS